MATLTPRLEYNSDRKFLEESTKPSTASGLTRVYSNDGKDFEGPWLKWSGPTLSSIQRAARQGDFRLEIALPPAMVVNSSVEYHGTDSPFDGCIYAATTGHLDLCVGTLRLPIVASWKRTGSSCRRETYRMMTLFQPYQFET